MSGSQIVLDSSISDSEEDLDLNLNDESIISEDELKEYLKLNSETPSLVSCKSESESRFTNSLQFVPLTSSQDLGKDAKRTSSQEPIYVASTDEEDDMIEIHLDIGQQSDASPSHVTDPPDYESPNEDQAEVELTKVPDYDYIDNVGSEDLAYDELLAMCGQGASGHDSNQDPEEEEEYLTSVPSKLKERKFKPDRKVPYSMKRRAWSGEGKGKQPMSGFAKKKSSRHSYSPSYQDKDMVVTDSGRPICFGDGLVNIDDFKFEDEKPVIPPPPPMICEACSKAEGHNSIVQCCEGHIVCTKCVEISTKTEFSEQKKGFVNCPQPECSSSVPPSELRKALPSLVLDLLEDSWKKQATEAIENMNDLVKCPSCEFSAALDIDVKRFQCIQCNEAYCRYCEKKWADNSNHDLCIQTKKWTSTVTGNVVNIPAHWTEYDTNTESHTIKEVDRSSAEFQDILGHMTKFMTINITKLYRIQNERLWEKYSLTKCHMIADLGEANINEKRLFHGTNNDVIDAICKEGFDWRLCGKHGVVYGQGTYFAKSPVVSHRYSSGRANRARSNLFAGFAANIHMGPGYHLFYHAGHQPNYKPPLRFGAPIATTGASSSAAGAIPPPARSSGFQFGSTLPTSNNTGFTFGTATTVGSSGTLYGAPATTAQSVGFRFGATTIANSNSGFNFGTQATPLPSSGYTFGLSVATSQGFDIMRGTGTSSKPLIGFTLEARGPQQLPTPSFQFGSATTSASTAVAGSVTVTDPRLANQGQMSGDSARNMDPRLANQGQMSGDPARNMDPRLANQGQMSGDPARNMDPRLANQGQTSGDPARNMDPRLANQGQMSRDPARNMDPRLANQGQTSGDPASKTGTHSYHKCKKRLRQPNPDVAYPHSLMTSGATLHQGKGPGTTQDPQGDDKGSCASDCSCIFCLPHKKSKTTITPKKINTQEDLKAYLNTLHSKAQAISTTNPRSSTKDILTVLEQRRHELMQNRIRFLGAVNAVPPASSASGLSASGQGSSDTGTNRSTSNNNPGGSNSGAGNNNNNTGGNSSRNSGINSAQPDIASSDDCFMFLARVLLGRSCVGSSNMRRPERDREGRETHSAVDADYNPSVFVIFDNTQCYPEYLIQYSTTCPRVEL